MLLQKSVSCLLTDAQKKCVTVSQKLLDRSDVIVIQELLDRSNVTVRVVNRSDTDEKSLKHDRHVYDI